MTVVISGVRRDAAFVAALDVLVDARFASRLFAEDASLWGEEAADEAASRLGWTDFEAKAEALVSASSVMATEFRDAGVDRFVLCGMGGSSLAPLVISSALTVLDSTHPDTVRAALAGDLARTAVVVSSKSGSTVETLSHLAAFVAAFEAAGINPAERIVAITDPGSSLESTAAAAGMRVVHADPNVGGRFSALTAFGIVPSVLAGADVSTIVREAALARDSFRADAADNPALVLAAALAAGLPERFVLEVIPDGTLPTEFGLWIEQLVAESTGKRGKGILPIALPLAAKATNAPAALAVQVGAVASDTDALGIFASLGEQFLLWETATAALGSVLGVDPFDQPDVEAAKIATRESLIAATNDAPDSIAASRLLAALRDQALPDGYIAIQAYVDSTQSRVKDLLEELRGKLAERLGVPVALGYGPRYLHSTGQFHKGGPAQAAFVQLVQIPTQDLEIPGSPQSFGELLAAQAAGDASVLQSRGRTVLRVETREAEVTLRELLASL